MRVFLQLDLCRRPDVRVLLVVFAGLAAESSMADTIRVPSDYPSVSQAMLAALNGDEIVIADGVYDGPDNRNLHFGGKLITIRSENGPENCIIDFEHEGRGFILESHENDQARIQGLTLMRSGGAMAGLGGAVQCVDSWPTIEGCVFVENFGGSGGAIGITGASAHPVIRDCVFLGNSATSEGGAIRLEDYAQAYIANCRFHGNQADDGGAVSVHRSLGVTIANCFFSGNAVSGVGGAVHVSDQAKGDIVNCSFFNNVASGCGGGIYIHHSFDEIFVTNCVLWGNESSCPTTEYDQILASEDSFNRINYNCIEGLTGIFGGVGNTCDDPRVADLAGLDGKVGTVDDDPRLGGGSSCIDAGSNLALPFDLADLDSDGDVQEVIPIDFNGQPRRFDDAGTVDIGQGQSPIVDIGAAEFSGTSSQSHAARWDFSFSAGTWLEGGLDECKCLDSRYLEGTSERGFSAFEPNVLDLEIGWITDIPSPSLFQMQINSNVDQASGVVKVRLRNWDSGLFGQVATYPIDFDYETVTLDDISAQGAVRKGDGRVETSIRHVVVATFTPTGFKSSFNWVSLWVE